MLTLVEERNKLVALQEQKAELESRLQSLLPMYQMLLAKRRERDSLKQQVQALKATVEQQRAKYNEGRLAARQQRADDGDVDDVRLCVARL